MSAGSRATPSRTSVRREERLRARTLQRQHASRDRLLRSAVAVGITLVVIVGLGFLATRSAQAQPGRSVPVMGQQHIDKGAAHGAYNSTPPTSGPHLNVPGVAPVAWGIYEVPIADEAQIPNLEHGGIMIQYSCQDCPDVVAQLQDFYNRWTPAHRLPSYPQSTKIVVAPYYDMPDTIALTAWGRIDTLDAYDEGRIVRFIEAFRDHGPEAVM